LFRRYRLQLGDRLVGALQRVEIDRAAQPRRGIIERGLPDLGQDLQALLGLVLGAQHIGEQQLREPELRP